MRAHTPRLDPETRAAMIRARRMHRTRLTAAVTRLAWNACWVLGTGEPRQRCRTRWEREVPGRGRVQHAYPTEGMQC
jgi:hypothetical protein